MKMCFLALCLFLSLAVNAADKPKNTPDGPRFNFGGINVATAVQLIYSEALQESFVIDPDVVTDQRTVSFRYDGSRGDLRSFIASFFDSLGLAIVRRGSVDFIIKKPQPVAPTPQDSEVFVYRPRFRDGSYLVDILGPLFKGSFTSKRTVHAAPGDSSAQKAAPPGSAAASIDRKTDTIVFTGSAAEIEKLNKIMPQVDFAIGDVLVRGVLYEVQTSSSDGSAFGLALGLLGGKLGVGLGSLVTSPGQSLVSFKNQTIDAVFSALSSDTRFKAVSKPTLRVVSGGTGRFTVGQDVPVLGSVSYPGGGQAPVQSVSYQSSGVIFDLQPVMHDSSIELSVMQQMSNFVVTSTGVNASPTLIKRELKSDLNLTDGEIVVLGGLAENKETDAHNGLSIFPSFLHTKTSEKSGIEILLILQVSKI